MEIHLVDSNLFKLEKPNKGMSMGEAIVDYWVYILHCENGNYYTGYTTDLTRRYAEHLAGTEKCKYTRSFKPLELAQSWKIEGGKSSAMKIEKRIKRLSKKEKEKLIADPSLLGYLVMDV